MKGGIPTCYRYLEGLGTVCICTFKCTYNCILYVLIFTSIILQYTSIVNLYTAINVKREKTCITKMVPSGKLI